MLGILKNSGDPNQLTSCTRYIARYGRSAFGSMLLYRNAELTPLVLRTSGTWMSLYHLSKFSGVIESGRVILEFTQRISGCAMSEDVIIASLGLFSVCLGLIVEQELLNPKFPNCYRQSGLGLEGSFSVLHLGSPVAAHWLHGKRYAMVHPFGDEAGGVYGGVKFTEAPEPAKAIGWSVLGPKKE